MIYWLLRLIKNPVKHLRYNFLRKQLDFDRVLNAWTVLTIRIKILKRCSKVLSGKANLQICEISQKSVFNGGESLQKLHCIVDFFLNFFKTFSENFIIAPVNDWFCSWFYADLFIFNLELIKDQVNATCLCCNKNIYGNIGKGKHSESEFNQLKNGEKWFYK